MPALARDESPVRGALRWTAALVALNIVSRLFGFLREVAVAYRFGAGAESDAYYVALLIPSVLFVAFRDGVRNAFIPAFSAHRERSAALLNTALVILLAPLLPLTALGLVFTPGLVALIAPGFAGDTFALAVRLTRIILPSVLFLGLAALVTAYLHTHRRFLAPAAVGLPYNLLIIAGALFLGAPYGIAGLAWASFAAFASQLFVQLPAAGRAGAALRAGLDFRHPGLGRALRLMPPIIFSGAGVELKQVVDRIFGSFLPAGSLTALSYADRLYNLPYNVFVLALTTVLYPTLVEEGQRGDLEAFRAHVRRGLSLIVFLVLPMIAGFALLRAPLVAVLFQRGAFDATAASRTATALLFYSLGMLGLGLRFFLERAFFALEDTRTPLAVTAFIVALNALLNYALIRPLAHGGIALATSLAATAGAAALLALLRRRLGFLGLRRLALSLGKSAAACLAMAAVLAPLASRARIAPGLAGAPRLLALVLLGAAVYFLAARLLRAPELAWLRSMIKKEQKNP